MSGLAGMSICKILHLVDSSGLYGAEAVILNLSKEMRKTSSFFPVVGMICQDTNSLPEIGVAAIDLGLEIKTFTSSFRFDPLCVFHINNYINHYQVSAVHSHGYKPSILAFLPCLITKKPLIIDQWFAL